MNNDPLGNSLGRKHYPQEYSERQVELAQYGRSIASLAEEFEPTEQTIRTWLDRANGHSERNVSTEARPTELSAATWRKSPGLERKHLFRGPARPQSLETCLDSSHEFDPNATTSSTRLPALVLVSPLHYL